MPAGVVDRRSAIVSLAVAATAAALVLSAQFLTVEFNRDGNWTALYCTGALNPLPSELDAEEVYRFRDTGFDGQFYHLIAHDPFLRHGLSRYIDDPRLRYRRILVPLLAFLAAAGNSALVDVAFVGVVLCWIFLGCYWLSRWAAGGGRSPAWGFAFLGVPATIVSADRLVADCALAALCVAFALALESRSTSRLYAVVLLAPLVRETGLLLSAAVCLWALWHRDWRRAALLASATIPCVSWYAYVRAQTAAMGYEASAVPLSGILWALAHPAAYADKVPVIARLDQVADGVALAGVLTAFGLRFWESGRGIRGPVELAGFLFALLGVLLQRRDHWSHVFDFGRVYSPLLLFLGLDWLRSGRWWRLLPTLLMYPRILLQLGSAILGALVGLSHRLWSSP